MCKYGDSWKYAHGKGERLPKFIPNSSVESDTASLNNYPSHQYMHDIENEDENQERELEMKLLIDNQDNRGKIKQAAISIKAGDYANANRILIRMHKDGIIAYDYKQ